jgi:hypothetical protein
VDVAELVAREAIRDLVAAYVHAADRGRFADVADLFAADGILELPDGRRAEGSGIVDFLRGTGADLRSATARPWVRHHVTSHRILLVDPAHAEGHAYYFVVTERGPDHWGRYHDRYVLVDGQWRFARRSVRLDGHAPGSWAAARRS